MRVSRASSPRPAATKRRAHLTADNLAPAIPAKAGISQPNEIKHKQQPADPFSLHGRRLG